MYKEASKSCSSDWPGTFNLHWNVLYDGIGSNDCEVEIDSAADISIVEKIWCLEPTVLTGIVDIEGVTGEIVKALIAKVLLQLGE